MKELQVKCKSEKIPEADSAHCNRSKYGASCQNY